MPYSIQMYNALNVHVHIVWYKATVLVHSNGNAVNFIQNNNLKNQQVKKF